MLVGCSTKSSRERRIRVNQSSLLAVAAVSSSTNRTMKSTTSSALPATCGQNPCRPARQRTVPLQRLLACAHLHLLWAASRAAAREVDRGQASVVVGRGGVVAVDVDRRHHHRPDHGVAVLRLPHANAGDDGCGENDDKGEDAAGGPGAWRGLRSAAPAGGTGRCAASTAGSARAPPRLPATPRVMLNACRW